MDFVDLQTPILGDGIGSINFFNGRLLSAEDLSKEQEANRQARRRLGLAIGDGVAYGLEVRKTPGAGGTAPSLVTVAPGLAVDRRGNTLRVMQRVDISLVRTNTATTATPVSFSAFGDCVPPQSGAYVAGEGVYLLTIAPAGGSVGRVAVGGLGNIPAACNTGLNVEGVQFRLIQLGLAADLKLTTDELNDRNRLRNLVAYKCFGVATTRSFRTDPFGPPPEPASVLDALRPNRLTDCDVPLALIYWTATGIQFVDMWAVRRPVANPSAEGWSSLVGSRHLSQAEAMFLQFQAQLQEIRTTEPNPAAMAATQRFASLPPAGFLPLWSTRAPLAFDYRAFFQGQTYRLPVFITAPRVEALMRASLAYPPIDLNNHELIWLYVVDQTSRAIDAGTTPSPQSYLIFASGHMPYYGDARFDVARSNYSSYADSAPATGRYG